MRFIIPCPQEAVVFAESLKSTTSTNSKGLQLSLPIKSQKAKQLKLESEIPDADKKYDTPPSDDAFTVVDNKKDALSEIIMKSKRIADAVSLIDLLLFAKDVTVNHQTMFIEQESDEEADSKDQPVLSRASIPGNKSYKFEKHFLCNNNPPRRDKDCPNARTIEIVRNTRDRSGKTYS
jgi:hypothetical protein